MKWLNAKKVPLSHPAQINSKFQTPNSKQAQTVEDPGTAQETALCLIDLVVGDCLKFGI
jgi:hypothetical protein